MRVEGVLELALLVLLLVLVERDDLALFVAGRVVVAAAGLEALRELDVVEVVVVVVLRFAGAVAVRSGVDEAAGVVVLREGVVVVERLGVLELRLLLPDVGLLAGATVVVFRVDVLPLRVSFTPLCVEG